MAQNDRPATASVLVYDDDVACAHAFADVLRAYGLTVQIANDFQPALAALEVASFDLLVADIVVPGGLNGLALARMARQRRPSIKTVYVTGYDLGAVAEHAEGPILQKPVSRQRLIDAVRGALAP